MRSKILTVSAAVLALGMTAACGGGSGDSSETPARDRPDQGVAVEQPRGDRLGQGDGRGVERRAPRGEGDGAGDPGRQDLRGGHRCRHHRRQRALPGVQHRPAAVPQFQKQGGLVALDDFDGAQRLHRGALAATRPTQYQSPDGKFYQIPWKQNPVMIFYNKEIFKKAGLDPENPPLSTYDDFLAASKKIVDAGAADVRDLARRRRASSSSPGSTSTRCTPRRPVASSSSRTARRRSTTRTARTVANFWSEMYEERPTPPRRRTTATRSPRRRPRWPSSARGRSRSTRTRSTGASYRCRPRTAATPAR